jgi:sulfide dehydrogenase cytochrome subunit
MKANFRHTTVLAVSIAAVAASAVAAPPPGQLLASMCFQCHGTNGQAVGGFESISGKSSREMYTELLEMSKRKKPEGIMDLQVRAFTPTQLLQIATYLSALPKGANSDD